jgi:ABC-type uncharacterized transport system fused permease/ATPase subunit
VRSRIRATGGGFLESMVSPPADERRRHSSRSLPPLLGLALAYFTGRERLGALSMLAFSLGLSVATAALGPMLNARSGDLVTALSSGTSSSLSAAIVAFFGILVVYIGVASVYEYLLNLLPIHWRRWLTTQVLDRYLRRRAYYRLGFDHTIDNPDQRIAEDINSFTQMSVVLSVLVVSAPASVLFSAIASSTSVSCRSKPTSARRSHAFGQTPRRSRSTAAARGKPIVRRRDSSRCTAIRTAFCAGATST